MRLLALGLYLGLTAARPGYGQQLPFQCLVQALPSSPAQLMQRGGATPLTACTDIQNVRVNVHFVQHDDGTGNFGAYDDGHPCNPSTAVTGYSYAEDLIWAANGQMANNPALRLAPGSTLNPVAKRVRWVLDGVYFDRNSTMRPGYYATNQDFGPLCVKADSVINLFLTEEVEWPYTQPRPQGCSSAFSMAFSNRGYVYSTSQANCNGSPAPAKLWAVVESPWTNYVLFGNAPWQIAAAVNHELCHLLGLNHPFQNLSTCADAPPHMDYPGWVLPNGQPGQCWNLNSPAGSHCDVLSKVSNNLMDYSAEPTSLSPCQVGIMQDNLNTCLQDRYVYKCSDCLPTRATFNLFYGYGANMTNFGLYLDGQASFHEHSFKIEIDEVLPAPFSGFRNHYEQTYNRQVDLEYLENSYGFQMGSTYRIMLRTYNYCGSVAVQAETVYRPGIR